MPSYSLSFNDYFFTHVLLCYSSQIKMTTLFVLKYSKTSVVNHYLSKLFCFFFFKLLLKKTPQYQKFNREIIYRIETTKYKKSFHKYFVYCIKHSSNLYSFFLTLPTPDKIILRRMYVLLKKLKANELHLMFIVYKTNNFSFCITNYIIHF